MKKQLFSIYLCIIQLIIYLSTYISIYNLLIYLSTQLSTYLSIYILIYLSTYLFYLLSYLSTQLSIYLSIYLLIYLSIYLYIYLSIYPFLYIYPSIYISIYLLPTYLYLYTCISIVQSDLQQSRLQPDRSLHKEGFFTRGEGYPFCPKLTVNRGIFIKRGKYPGGGICSPFFLHITFFPIHMQFKCIFYPSDPPPPHPQFNLIQSPLYI